MANYIKSVFLGLLLCSCSVESGPGAIFCVPACHTAFMACLAGCVGPQGAVMVGLCYAAVTTCDLSCVGATCLDGSNLVATESGQKKVSEVMIGDKVATLDDAGQLAYTKVVRNVPSEGLFGFIEVKLEDGKAFNVTKEHIVAVKRATGALETEQAQNLRVDDVMVTSLAQSKVVSTRFLDQESKWTLGTASGSILVNEVLMTSACDDSFAELPKDFFAAIRSWRQTHEPLFELLEEKASIEDQLDLFL